MVLWEEIQKTCTAQWLCIYCIPGAANECGTAEPGRGAAHILTPPADTNRLANISGQQQHMQRETCRLKSGLLHIYYNDALPRSSQTIYPYAVAMPGVFPTKCSLPKTPAHAYLTSP